VISLARVAATPLTYGSFSPYGHIIHSFSEHFSASQNSTSIIRGIKVTSANQGTARKYDHIAPVINYRQSNILLNENQSDGSGNFVSDKTRIIAKAEPNLSLYKCTPVKSFPFCVRLLERHPYSSQMFVPLGTSKVKGYLVVVCLSNEDDKPDLSTFNAFFVPSTHGISYYPGVWHHPMIALGEVSYTNF
jgi:allantoicase